MDENKRIRFLVDELFLKNKDMEHYKFLYEAASESLTKKAKEIIELKNKLDSITSVTECKGE